MNTTARRFSRFAAVAALSLAAATPTLAADSMSGQSMSMGGKMASCASGNPAVIVNTSKMTYEMDTKANRTAMAGMMSHDKFVCKSTADKMGAKMKPSSMMMQPKSKM